jgi:hypothetical protein
VSSKRSEPPLHLEPRSSRQLALVLLLTHGAAMAAIIQLPLEPWLMGGLAGSVIMSLYFTVKTHVQGRGRMAVWSLVWHADGEWTLLSEQGEELKARLLPATYVHPKLVLLNFAVAGRGYRAVVLMEDSLDRATFRRLLVRLRMDGGRNDLT